MTSNASSLAWRDEYSIGVAELDEQHKRLLELLNKLSTSETGFASGVTRPNNLMKLLDELNEYAAFHFLCEEKLMREHLPTDEVSAKHLIAHRSYWQAISNFTRRHENNESNVASELLAYLNRWWLNHILQTDKKLGEFLNFKGIH